MASSVSPGSTAGPSPKAPGGTGPGFTHPLNVVSAKFILNLEQRSCGMGSRLRHIIGLAHGETPIQTVNGCDFNRIAD